MSGQLLIHHSPHLISQWNQRKNDLLPSSFSYGSNQKVWWVCEKGHDFLTAICHRTLSHRGCPFCSGRYPTPDNNLKIMYPNIASELLEEKSGYLATELAPKSHKKVWWRCSRSHEYQRRVVDRTAGHACVICHSLALSHPHLLFDWDYQLNSLSPLKITAGSKHRVWWRCYNQHNYQTSIKSRALLKTGCPYCSKYKPSDTNNLQILFPDIAKFLHPTKNGTIDPKLISPYSRRLLWWQCSQGHNYKARVADKTAKKIGCKFCYQISSLPEKLWLDQLGIKIEYRQHHLKIGHKRMIVDAYDPQTNTIYEFYGDFWHGNPKVYDKDCINKKLQKPFGWLYQKVLEKEKLLKSNGYKLVTIWESDFTIASHNRDKSGV